MKNNVNLATTTSVTTTYSGQFAGEYVAAALLSATSLEAGGLTIKPNVKYKTTLKKLATSGLLKDATCDFDATGAITLTEKVCEPKRIHMNLQVCKDDYRNDWEAESMGFSAHDNLPKNFSDYLLGHVMASVASQVEQNIWTGDSSNDGEINGIETEIALDANLPAAQEVSGAAVSASTIIVELRKITAAIPDRVYGQDGLKIYCSKAIIKAYIGALGGHVAAGVGGSGTLDQGTQWYTDGSLTFDGIPLFMASGMTSTVAIATTQDNLVFACGLMNDQQEVKVLDMADIDLSDNVRIAMKFTGVATYIHPEDMVTYGITNGAN